MIIRRLGSKNEKVTALSFDYCTKQYLKAVHNIVGNLFCLQFKIKETTGTKLFVDFN